MVSHREGLVGLLWGLAWSAQEGASSMGAGPTSSI